MASHTASDLVGTLPAVPDARGKPERPHFACPFCSSFDVVRLFVGSVNVDSCECVACGARWDEDSGSGRYKGRGERSSVLMPRHD